MKSIKLLLLLFKIFQVISIIQDTENDEILEIDMEKTFNREPIKLDNFFMSIKEKDEYTYYLEKGSIMEMNEIKQGLYTITLQLGSPVQKFKVLVDTGSFLLWVPSSECNSCIFNENKFNAGLSISSSKTNERMDLRYISGSISGIITEDKVTLSDYLSVENFKFLVCDSVNAPVNVDGILGLARKYDRYDKTFSLIESLYRSGAIKRKIFTQKLSSSKFYIGNIPKEIAEDEQNFTSCKNIFDNSKINSFWTCRLKKVLMSDTRHERLTNNKTAFNYPYNINIEPNKKKAIELTTTTKPAIFDTGSNVIIAPIDLFTKFKYFYFKEEIENKTCRVVEDSRTDKSFICNRDIDLDKLPKLSFVFDNDYIYDLNIKDLFVNQNYKREYVFKIVFSEVPGSGWLLGQPFLKQYHMVFDYHTDSVGFYPIKDELTTNIVHNLIDYDLSTIGEERHGWLTIFYLYALFYYLIGLLFGISSMIYIKFFRKVNSINICEDNNLLTSLSQKDKNIAIKNIL